MATIDYEKALAALEYERLMELRCAEASKKIMRKTLNPFRRFSLKRSAECFMQHVVGIELAIYRFKKECGPTKK